MSSKKPRKSSVRVYICKHCSGPIRANMGGFLSHERWCGTPIEDRVWAKVRKTPTCWLWTASVKPNGYGHFSYLTKDYMAHRWAYEHFLGEIPAGMEVMHTCDVPNCVNPMHLRLGTHQQNMADCKAKDRHARGDRGRSKLSEAQARHVLSLKGKAAAADLADKYGVRNGAIEAIWAGRAWKHIQEIAA